MVFKLSILSLFLSQSYQQATEVPDKSESAVQAGEAVDPPPGLLDGYYCLDKNSKLAKAAQTVAMDTKKTKGAAFTKADAALKAQDNKSLRVKDFISRLEPIEK